MAQTYTSPPPKFSLREFDWRKDKEKLFENLNAHRDFFESFLPESKATSEASLEQLRIANAKIHEQFPDYFPKSVERPTQARKIKPPRKQWPLERKQALRLKKMVARVKKKYSIPILYQEAVQAELVKKPHYFGVCQIDGTSCVCPNYGMLIAQAEAIAYENECRAKGEA